MRLSLEIKIFFNTVPGVNSRSRLKIQHLVERIFEGEGRGESLRVNVIVTDDEFLSGLNEKYFGKSSPTDVISFNLQDEERDSGTDDDDVFGEIYVSWEQASAYADDSQDGRFDGELLRLVAHGSLHLLGYDHEEDREREMMRAKENAYLSRATTL